MFIEDETEQLVNLADLRSGRGREPQTRGLMISHQLDTTHVCCTCFSHGVHVLYTRILARHQPPRTREGMPYAGQSVVAWQKTKTPGSRAQEPACACLSKMAQRLARGGLAFDYSYTPSGAKKKSVRASSVASSTCVWGECMHVTTGTYK